MTNQMKNLLFTLLILSYSSLAVGVILFVVGGLEYESFICYVVFGLEVPLCISLQLLYTAVLRKELELKSKINYAKTLLELREGAKLKFYKDNGIKPKYNKDGTLMSPDEFIGILTKLDKDGKLEKSIYEILGIMPQFDEFGNEIPYVVIIKHLIEKFKTSGLDKFKGVYKAVGSEKVAVKPEKAKTKTAEAQKVGDAKKAGAKKKDRVVYGKILKGGGGNKTGGKDDGKKASINKNKQENVKDDTKNSDSETNNSRGTATIAEIV